MAAAKEELIAQGAKLEKRDAELRRQGTGKIISIQGGSRAMVLLLMANVLVGGMNVIHGRNRELAAARRAHDAAPPAVSGPVSPGGSEEAPEEPQIHTLTDYNFERLTARGIWVIDVWAEWCGPCMRARPHFEELQKWYGDQIELGSYDYGPRDSERERKLIDRFGAPNRGIPQFIVVQNGFPKGVILGFGGPDEFHEDIHGLLSPFGVEIQRR